MKKRIKVSLVFDGWRDQRTGESVYGEPIDIENGLSLGSYHSGTVFDAEIEINLGDDGTLEAAQKLGIVPLFWVEIAD
jgi:hypothetical protein